MKKILGLLVLTASIFAFAVFFTSCVTVGVSVSGGKSVEATMHGSDNEDLIDSVTDGSFTDAYSY